VPQPRVAPNTSRGDEALAVQAEGHAIRVRNRLTDWFVGFGVPQPHSPALGGGDDALAVRANRHRNPFKRLTDRLATFGVPHPPRSVLKCGDNALAVEVTQ